LGRSILIVPNEELNDLAVATGFRPEILEKVIQLQNLLSGIFSHPYLKNRLVLKGGTALNLFTFKLPRLSVDIDINYVGAIDRDTMLEERPVLERAINAVCSREDLTVIRVPREHAGGKWRLKYQSDSRQGGNLELDLNFILRSPLWCVKNSSSINVGQYTCEEIPIVDIHELAAGKLTALFARTQARDIFDIPQLLAHAEIDPELLRIGFVVYGAMNVKDWREMSIADIRLDDDEFSQNLIPMLPSTYSIDKTTLLTECQNCLDMVLPLRENELEFIADVRDRNQIVPSLITEDGQLQDTLLKHPGLLWRAK
jgi:predicted nucleotidyltransferase component of viral defense system